MNGYEAMLVLERLSEFGESVLRLLAHTEGDYPDDLERVREIAKRHRLKIVAGEITIEETK